MHKQICTAMKDFGGSIRKYFDFGCLRIMLVEHYADLESWHKHETTSQIIYVIEGTIKVYSTTSDGESGSEIVSENEFIVIPAEEWHKVVPETDATKLVVIKYIEQNINIIEQLKSDYVRMPSTSETK